MQIEEAIYHARKISRQSEERGRREMCGTVGNLRGLTEMWRAHSGSETFPSKDKPLFGSQTEVHDRERFWIMSRFFPQSETFMGESFVKSDNNEMHNHPVKSLSTHTCW